eukprot:363193-Chlamydomonas_euryale.AAC.7
MYPVNAMVGHDQACRRLPTDHGRSFLNCQCSTSCVSRNKSRYWGGCALAPGRLRPCSRQVANL